MYCFKSCCEIKLPFNVKPGVSFSSLGDNSHKWKGKQLPNLLSDKTYYISFWIKYLINPFAREGRFMPSNTDGVQCILSLQLLWYQEAQTRRMVEVGGELWRSSGPIAQDYVLLNISKEKDSTASLFNLCQHSETLTVQPLLLMLRQHLLCFICAHCLWSCH